MYYFYHGQFAEVTAYETLPPSIAGRVGHKWQSTENWNNRSAPYNYVAESVSDLYRNVPDVQRWFRREAIEKLQHGETLDCGQ